MKTIIRTTIDGSLIQQRWEQWDESPWGEPINLAATLHAQQMDTSDRAVRQALIAMGWMPPEAARELREAAEPFIRHSSSWGTVYINIKTADIARLRQAVRQKGEG